MRFEIKHKISRKILFSVEIGSFKLAVEAAVQKRADLRDANLRDANLGGADLGGADLMRADLWGADLWGANLRGANLRGADLRDANLGGADLRDANLGGADLMRANLRGANLREANLRGADLRDANLGGADLRDANLWGANLWGANLRGANLREANLRGANLGGADLRGANLRGANLRGANLREAQGINLYHITPLLMLLDQPGPIRAYKLVNENFEGPFNGGIIYKIGQSYEVPEADTDAGEHCGKGINVATLDWCLKEYQEGYHILFVEFSAADIAAIPTGTDGKFRLFRCTVVGEKDLSKILSKQEKSSDEAV